MKNKLVLILFTFIALTLFQNCGSKSNNEKSDFTESNSENNIADSVCSIHNKNCLAIASELGMNIEDYHKWQNEQQESIEMEDANVDANGDIVDPNASYSRSPQSINYNAWQCTRCGALSRSLKEPSGGDFGGTGGCTDNGNHYWSHANTNRGWQCSRCGATSYCDREPSGGDFGGTGGCSNNGNHYWNKF